MIMKTIHKTLKFTVKEVPVLKKKSCWISTFSHIKTYWNTTDYFHQSSWQLLGKHTELSDQDRNKMKGYIFDASIPKGERNCGWQALSIEQKNHFCLNNTVYLIGIPKPLISSNPAFLVRKSCIETFLDPHFLVENY